MRKAVVLALALGVALPVAAHAQNASDDRHHHDDRGGGDKHDGDRGKHGDHEQPARAPGPAPAVRGPDQGGRDNRIQAAPGINRLDGHTPYSDGRGYPVPVRDVPGRGVPQGAPDRDRGGPPNAGDRDHRQPGDWGRDRGSPQGGWDRDHRAPPGNYGRPPYAGRDWRQGAPGGWNRNWRQDQRFDWQRYRAYNRDRFRAPRYYAPRGYDYGYRRWYPGIRIAPYFFAQQYLLGDPFFYHLPPPPPGCAWVRYYNDVALVDLGDGEVIDVIPDFFF